MRLRYEEHTWPELRELAKREDLVVVIPTATLEDHGHHLPIDTDARLVSAICERAVEASGGQALLFPTQVHGCVLFVNRREGATTGAWPGIQSFCGWKQSGVSGKGGLGHHYLPQFMREQSRTVME